MSEIKISGYSSAKMNLGGMSTRDHNKLKNLGFEESGHTGFQEQLTEEQLKVINNPIKVDSELSEISENPVQNKAVKGYIDTAIQTAILDSWEVAV